MNYSPTTTNIHKMRDHARYRAMAKQQPAGIRHIPIGQTKFSEKEIAKSVAKVKADHDYNWTPKQSQDIERIKRWLLNPDITIAGKPCKITVDLICKWLGTKPSFVRTVAEYLGIDLPAEPTTQPKKPSAFYREPRDIEPIGTQRVVMNSRRRSAR
jgi:hypothetical protein